MLINNPDFENDLSQMYPAELEIKDTTESNTSSSYFDLVLSIEKDSQLQTSHYEERDDYKFRITKLPFMRSNIQSSSVFVSQLILFVRTCSF